MSEWSSSRGKTWVDMIRNNYMPCTKHEIETKCNRQTTNLGTNTKINTVLFCYFDS